MRPRRVDQRIGRERCQAVDHPLDKQVGQVLDLERRHEPASRVRTAFARVAEDSNRTTPGGRSSRNRRTRSPLARPRPLTARCSARCSGARSTVGSTLSSTSAPSLASGPLVLADISGYTSFLQTVAFVHRDDAFADGRVPEAYEVLSGLLDGTSGASCRRSPAKREGERSSPTRTTRPPSQGEGAS